MIIGIGRSPLADFVKKRGIADKQLYPYPAFFDNKISLLRGRTGYILYLKKLLLKRQEIKIAVWPDYVKLGAAAKVIDLSLLSRIMFIVPIHSLSDIIIGKELEDYGFSIFYGYASDAMYRNYNLTEFLNITKGKRWYLGISTKHELTEALRNNFNGMDITGYIFGQHMDRKNPELLKKKLQELLQLVSKPQGRQTSLYDFLLKESGKLGSLPSTQKLNSPVDKNNIYHNAAIIQKGSEESREIKLGSLTR
uniref:hypothetical protein n=1 Tax=Sulfolobus sp. NOB8H2 TaxID=84600 RepID=UPI002106C09D|nr:hypothetical protein [Sulfolobus sp. NOB8H2]